MKRKFSEEAMKEAKKRILIKNGYSANFLNEEWEVSAVLHETEFLSTVVDSLEYADLDSKFLSACTGISESVFDQLQKEENYLPNNSDILEVIKATVGIMAFAKMALDYYGIVHFYSVDGQIDSIRDFGDGFYHFCIC